MLFELKKMQKETLGDYLTAIRKSQGLLFADVASQAGIPVSFLLSLEAGRLAELPADVYTRGFLKRLAELYGIAPETILPQYKKERKISVQLGSKIRPKTRWSWRKQLVVTPARISVSALVLFVLATLGYVVYQVRAINHDPGLVVYEPQNGSAVRGSFAQASGHTDPGNQLAINGTDVFVAEDGHFTTTISLGSGTRELSFVARNKFGKTSSRVVSVVGQPGDAPASTLDSAALNLELHMTAPATITVAVDGKVQAPEYLDTGATRQFMATDQILLSTSDAGSTKLLVNGQNFGPLGRVGEALRDIPFTSTSALLVNARSQHQSQN